MNVIDVEDRLETLGVVAGAFLVLVGLGTVVGMPWETNNDMLASVVQLIGVAAMIAVGVGLARLSYVSE
ncbi:MAG: hypothetical protein ACI8XM_000704 [Haloarculaceae archaeon]|jgi:hypothetical protein